MGSGSPSHTQPNSLSRLLPLLLLAATPPSALSVLPCQSDDDCLLNGMCIVGNGECMCYKGWVGQECGMLDVLPVPAPHAGPPGVSYGTLASHNTTGLATWGGSLIKDPDSPSLYHLFAVFSSTALNFP